MATAIDNLGRKIDSTNMSLGEIKALIGTMMKSKVGAARPVESKKEGAPQDDIGKVRKLLEQYTKDFAKDMQEQKGFLSDVVDSLKDLVQRRLDKKAESKGQPKKEKKEKPFVSKEEKAMSKSSEGLYKTFAKKGSGYTHDIYVEKAIRDLCSCIKGISPPSTPSPAPDDGGAAGGGGSGGSTGGGGAAPGGGKKKEKTRMMGGLPIADDLVIMSYFIGQITNELAKVEQQILGFNALSEVFKGIIKQEREFIQGMRAISYETAGATKEATSLMRSFEDIGTTTKQTGVDRDVYQKAYIKALKHGIKDLKVASNIVKTQLNTEKQLGMEAGSLGEEFVSWTKAGRMSVGQIADMGRGMREVARNTGMTGEELATVVKGSKEFIDSLRNAATLSATAAKNIIEIGVNAKKLGIESQMQPLLKAMSSSSHLILEASNQTRGFLLSAASSVGRIDELMNGTILRSKAGIKDMAKGMDNMLKRFGVESMDAIDQLSDDAKMRLNIQLKSTFGIELGELRSQYEALNEAGKGMAERLADINKKRQQNLTLEEKATLMEDERRLKTSKNLEVLTALDEAAKGAKDMNQALATFGKRRGEFEADLNALGQTWTSEADVARGAIQSAMDSVNAGLKKAGKQEIKIDSTEIERALKDPAAMRELTGKIAKGEQELATAQKAQLDPMTDMQQSLSEINDNIRNFTNKGFSSLFNSLIGKIAVIGAAIAGVIGGISLLAIGIISKIDSFSRVFKEMKDNGGPLKVLMGAILRRRDDSPDPADVASAAAAAASARVKDTGKNTAATAVTDALAGLKKDDDQDIFPLMLKELQAIRQCICTDKSKIVSDKAAVEAKAAASPDKAKFAADRAAGQAKAASMTDEQKTTARTERRKANAQARSGKLKAAPSTDTPVTPKTEFDIAGMMSAGKEMAKAAIGVAILGVGVVALGAAIVFLSAKIMKAFKLDIKTVLETAAVVGAVALAGGAIAAAGFVAFEALNSSEMKGFTEKAKSSYPQVLEAAAALMLIGPAIVLLGAAVVAMTGLILSKLGLSIGSVAETAGVIVAVAGVAGAMAAGAKAFVECLDELQANSTWKKIVDSPGKIAGDVGKAALALVLVGGVIMLLGVALVKMGQIIMSAAGLDISTVAKIATHIGALIVAAGAIAGAIIGASFGLKSLGEFVERSKGMKDNMIKGAIAFLVMTPAITALAAGVVWITQKIMGAFGMDSGAAAKAAMNIGELILAAGFISLAIIGASAGLFALGTLAQVAYTALPLMALGAGALLLLAPAIAELAVGVIKITQWGMSGLDLGAAAKTAKDLAGVIMAAGFIALAVMGAAWGLSALASLVLTGAIWPIIKMAAAGGAALLLLTPAMTALASGIINMAQSVMKNNVDPSTAGKVAESLADIISAAAEISLSVLGMGAALAALGFVVATGLFWTMVPLALLGAAALLVLTPAIVGLNTAIIHMAQSIMKGTVGPEEAKATSEALASILESAASISWSVIKSATTLGILGLLAGFSAMAWVITGAMYLGSKALQFLTPAVVHMANTIIQMAGGLMATGVSPAHGKEIADSLSSILSSAGNIADGVLRAVGNLSKLMMASWKASMFGYAFMSMANAINNGILQPMKLLPPSSEIDEVVNQLDGMVQALNKVEEVLVAMDIAMKSISNSGLDFSALDKIPIQKMAMFASALKDMTAATGSAAGGGDGGITPSDKNIETQLLRDQAIAQQTMAKSLSEMVVEALTGNGLFVRDRLNFKAQNDMIKIQRDEAKSALMPSAAQVAASKDSGFEEFNKKFNKSQQDQAIKNAQAKNNPLKPAIQSVNPKPAAGNIDMRRASASMRDTPMQRALGDEARERRIRNPYTDRLKERNEARRIRREQSGFETSGTIMPSQGGSVRGSAGSLRGEAHGQGLMTEQAMAQAIERQAREAQGNQPIGYKLANAASSQQIANQGMMPLSVEPMSVAGAGESPASVRPIAQTSPAMPDMHSAIAGERAATSPTKTEITSPELGAIASEAGDHNAKLDTLITLFQQVLTALKPTSTPITSSGGMNGNTSTKEVVHKPANFFKNPVGMVTQTPGKAILNVGTPKG